VPRDFSRFAHVFKELTTGKSLEPAGSKTFATAFGHGAQWSGLFHHRSKKTMSRPKSRLIGRNPVCTVRKIGENSRPSLPVANFRSITIAIWAYPFGPPG
jgi:hypothetical protein